MPSVTLKGNAIEVAGTDLAVGGDAPDFSLQAIDLSEVNLAAGAGKTRIIATVPSLDTPVCHEETKKFNEAAGGMDNVEVYCVSMDLPFGQKRWCGAEGVENVKTSVLTAARSSAKTMRFSSKAVHSIAASLAPFLLSMVTTN